MWTICPIVNYRWKYERKYLNKYHFDFRFAHVYAFYQFVQIFDKMNENVSIKKTYVRKFINIQQQQINFFNSCKNSSSNSIFSRKSVFLNFYSIALDWFYIGSFTWILSCNNLKTGSIFSPVKSKFAKRRGYKYMEIKPAATFFTENQLFCYRITKLQNAE